MYIIALSILASLFWAVSNVIDKFVVSVDFKNNVLGVLNISMISLLPLFFALLTIFNIGYPSTYTIGFTYLLVGIFYFLAMYFYFKALKIAEATSVSILTKLSSVFILIGEILFLSGSFKIIQIFGMFLLLTSSVIASMESFKDIKINKSFWLMLVSGLMFAMRGLVADYAVQGQPIKLYTWSIIGAVLCTIIILSIKKESRSNVLNILKNRKETKPIYIAISNNIGGFGILSYIIAIDTGSVSIVSFVTSTQPIIVFIIVIILDRLLKIGQKELDREYSKRNTIKTLISILLAITGIILLS